MLNFKEGDNVYIQKPGDHSHGFAGVIDSFNPDTKEAVVKSQYGERIVYLDYLRFMPKVGDRVRILKTLGARGGEEGTVGSVSPWNTMMVIFNDDSGDEFYWHALDVIDRAPETRREEGKTILPMLVKEGDKITITIRSTKSEIEQVSSFTAIVGKVILRNGNIEFQTRSGNHIFGTRNFVDDSYEITLVESIDDNKEYRDLQAFGEGAVIAFPDSPDALAMNLAIRTDEESKWNVLEDSKGKNTTTLALLNNLRKKGVTYTVLRKR